MPAACCPSDPNYIAIATLVSSIIFALIAAYIAWRQSQIARNKLKFDLFDKRFKVFDASRNFIQYVAMTRNVNDEKLHDFVAGTIDARWLLDDEIHSYLRDQVFRNATELQGLQLSLQTEPVGEQRNKYIAKESQTWRWMQDQLNVLGEKFEGYLTLSH